MAPRLFFLEVPRVEGPFGCTPATSGSSSFRAILSKGLVKVAVAVESAGTVGFRDLVVGSGGAALNVAVRVDGKLIS